MQVDPTASAYPGDAVPTTAPYTGRGRPTKPAYPGPATNLVRWPWPPDAAPCAR